MEMLVVHSSTQGISLSMLSNTTVYLIAVACSCGASFCMAFGLILMKYANIKVENMHNSQARFYCQIEWLFGLLLLICNIFLNMRK